jgi:hypothetical protein
MLASARHHIQERCARGWAGPSTARLCHCIACKAGSDPAARPAAGSAPTAEWRRLAPAVLTAASAAAARAWLGYTPPELQAAADAALARLRAGAGEPATAACAHLERPTAPERLPVEACEPAHGRRWGVLP